MKKCLFVFIVFLQCTVFASWGENDIYYDASTVERSPLKVSLYAKNSRVNQSSARYGDYLILVPKGRGVLYLYNLRTKTMLCSIKMKPGVGKDAWGYDLYHSNQATFGCDFYDKNDPFPLLYISQRARKDKRCFAEVYRIVPSKTDEDTDYTSMKVQLVQTVFFPVMSTENSLGNVNCVIDGQAKLMYTYSRNNNSGEHNSGMCKITCFDIPPVKEDTVMLDDSSIRDSYMLPCRAVYMQGGCIKDGRLYIGQGYKSAGYIYLNIVNLNERCLEKRIDLLANGVTWEPEGCFVYEGCVMMSSGVNIWKFNAIP